MESPKDVIFCTVFGLSSIALALTLKEPNENENRSAHITDAERFEYAGYPPLDTREDTDDADSIED